MPALSRFVRAAMALATTIGADRAERFGVKCASPNHAVSTPVASARSISSNASRKLSSWVPPRRTAKSTLIPKSIPGLLTATVIEDACVPRRTGLVRSHVAHYILFRAETQIHALSYAQRER